MSIRTVSELKALFQTGDTPSQNDFGDLIDTTYDFGNQAAADAAAAAASAAAAEAAVLTAPVAPVSGQVQLWLVPGSVGLVGCTVAGPGGGFSGTINFDVAFPDTNYFVIIHHVSGSATENVTAKNVGSIVIGAANTWVARIAVYPYTLFNAVLNACGLLTA